MNRRFSAFGTMSALALLGCSGSPPSGDLGVCESCDEETAAAPMRYTDWGTTWDVVAMNRSIEQLQARAGTYAPDDFIPLDFKREMVMFDEEIRDCDVREYSVSKESGVALFDSFIQSLPSFADVHDYQLADMREIASDPGNRAVFASLWDEAAGGDQEDCAYAHFYVFDAGHTVASFTFDYRSGWVDQLSPMETDIVQFPGSEDSELVSRLQDYGGNGGSAIGTFDPEAFDEEAALAHIAEYDFGMGHCEDRRVETTTAGVLGAFDEFAADPTFSPFSPDNDWFDGSAAEADHEDLRTALADENNVAVISSTWKDDSTDYSEGCLYFDYYAFRQDGTAWRFTVSFTD